MWKEVLKVFKSDSILNEATNDALEMLTQAQEMFVKSTKIIRTSDKDIQNKIRKKDRHINQKMESIRRKVLVHLSSNPSDFDLNSSLILLNIVVDIERIGDYTKNISDLTAYRKSPMQDENYNKELNKIEKDIRVLFISTIDCLESYNNDSALKLLERHKWISKTCDQYITEFIKGERKDLSKSDIASYALYFRWLKRINCHLRNILTTIVNPFDRIGFSPAVNQ